MIYCFSTSPLGDTRKEDPPAGRCRGKGVSGILARVQGQARKRWRVTWSRGPAEMGSVCSAGAPFPPSAGDSLRGCGRSVRAVGTQAPWPPARRCVRGAAQRAPQHHDRDTQITAVCAGVGGDPTPEHQGHPSPKPAGWGTQGWVEFGGRERGAPTGRNRRDLPGGARVPGRTRVSHQRQAVPCRSCAQV